MDTIHPNELRAQPARNLLPRLFRDISSLATQEVDLAKAELTEKSGLAAGAARTFTLSAACAAMALVTLSACVIAALALVLALWFAFLIVGVIYAIAALAFASAARAAVNRGGGLLPTRTARHLFAPSPTDEPLRADELRADATKARIDGTLAALGSKTDLLTPMRDAALAAGSLAAALAASARSQNGSH
ncbi:MAG: phage holin family protein [Vulcanimicrobiaceae bacterium]